MKKALENLKTKVRNKQIKIVRMDVLDKLEIKPSHYYVKFKPKTDEQEGLMRNDSTLELFDYPLDWEFTNDYLDNRPDPPEGTFLDYYTSVSVDKVLPDKVPRETLAVLYIPEQDSILNKAGNEDILIYLRNEAFTLTGNEDDLLEEPPKGPQAREAWFIGSRWNPSGTVQFWDDGAGETTYTDRTVRWIYYDCPDDRDSRDDDIRERTRRCRWPDYTYTKRTVRGKYVPLVAARILIRQWFTIRKTFTNENGYFRAGSVRGKARYVVKWERYHYSIRRGWIFQAFLRGPKYKRQNWVHNIKGGRHEYHAAIHTAAYAYYYTAGRLDLTSPPRNIWYRRQIKIAAKKTGGASSYARQRRFYKGSDISIKEYDKDSDLVFGITIHELAHAAHYRISRSAYKDIVWDAYTRPCITRFNCDNNLSPSMNNKRRLLETWATTVEIVFALQRYRDDFGQSGYKYQGNFQNQEIESNKSHRDNHYTSAGYDMIDTVDQRAGHKGDTDYPRDRVSGYTIRQLEDALKGAKSWSEWKDHIRNIDTSNPTRDHLDELFNNWPN